MKHQLCKESLSLKANLKVLLQAASLRKGAIFSDLTAETHNLPILNGVNGLSSLGSSIFYTKSRHGDLITIHTVCLIPMLKLTEI